MLSTFVVGCVLTPYLQYMPAAASKTFGCINDIPEILVSFLHIKWNFAILSLYKYVFISKSFIALSNIQNFF